MIKKYFGHRKANATGGKCSYPVLVGHLHTSGRRSGLPIRFQSILGNIHSLDYESVCKLANNEHYHYLRIPIEMEFHTRHFYARGVLSFGIGLKERTAANDKECFNIGETVLELGGFIASSPQFAVTVMGEVFTVMVLVLPPV